MRTKRKPQSVYQYEPLVTPSNWSGEERQFVVRLTQLFDQLFARKTEPSGTVEPGTPGEPGKDGVGVPTGGEAGQILAKKSGDDYDTEWVSPPENSGVDLLSVYPVESVYTTASSTINPAALFGGTWELIDKVFSNAIITDFFTHNSTNISEVVTANAYRSGHDIRVWLTLTKEVEMADSTLELGTLDFTVLGISATGNTQCVIGFDDGGNGLSNTYILTTGKFEHRDCVTKTSGGSLSAGGKLSWSFVMHFMQDQMLDSACDQFVWRRIA